MKWWIINILTVMSLLLCIGTVVLWMRSYSIGNEVTQRRSGPQWNDSWSISSGMGHVVIRRWRWPATVPKTGKSEVSPLEWRASDPSLPSLGYVRISLWNRLGFRHDQLTFMRTAIIRMDEVTLPLWAVAIPLSLPLGARIALWAFSRIRQGRRNAMGLCLNCGYDLRASKDRCPECGESIAAGGVKGMEHRHHAKENGSCKVPS